MATTDNNNRTNPFLQPYATPHGSVPFDNISIEDYEEAFLEGIRREDEQIEKLLTIVKRLHSTTR